MIDALRADHLGINGYPLPVSPTLDGLGAEGVNFTSAFANATWTKPSIATLFTSLYPSEHGIRTVGLQQDGQYRALRLGDDRVTLAERLRDAGYRTGALLSQPHLAPGSGFEQGFEHYRDVGSGRGAFAINSQLGRWLASLQGGPVFAYVHYLNVHWPYNERLKERREDWLGAIEMARQPPVGQEALRAWGRSLSREELRPVVARYDNGIAWCDLAVKDLLATLETQGMLENTLLIVTADHGEAFQEHGELFHGLAPYDEQLHVPLIVRLPPALRRWTGVMDETVALIDIAPTILELLGLPALPGASGVSFAPLLDGASGGARLTLSETADAFAIRGRHHKLIVTEPAGEAAMRCFDLERDPGESEPILPPFDGPCRALARELQPSVKRMLRLRESQLQELMTIDAEQKERLRSLGYVD